MEPIQAVKTLIIKGIVFGLAEEKNFTRVAAIRVYRKIAGIGVREAMDLLNAELHRNLLIEALQSYEIYQIINLICTLKISRELGAAAVSARLDNVGAYKLSVVARRLISDESVSLESISHILGYL